ncbi:type I 3-dehydroquinate dehydratase [Catenisphaera adipataccumulans]|uniref:3-dehydroquinate dehydratase n=1 Tax=Catenisphaera adipataccumulans TaxID=700500 RepID=A0A7W8FX22_9FIRM|nr:type I 3-dehydroquinate dehydratase [Catenisphaera adipataccumulans]MBB5183235.1 3-dehydroquinate dehydratase type I [Catenisphaera adipataccumulans]
MKKMKTICPIFLSDTGSYWQELQALEDSVCDLIEIRLDAFPQEQLLHWSFPLIEKSLAAVSKPVILTIRTKSQGGQVDIDAQTYEKWLRQMLRYDCYLDVELEHARQFEQPLETDKMVISYHDFQTTPNDLDAIWEEMDEYEAAIEKIACMPQTTEDVTRLLISCFDHATSSEKLVIAMGETGRISRIIGGLFDSSYTFCTLSTSSAPGQVPLDQAVKYLDILAQDAGKNEM